MSATDHHLWRHVGCVPLVDPPGAYTGDLWICDLCGKVLSLPPDGIRSGVNARHMKHEGGKCETKEVKP